MDIVARNCEMTWEGIYRGDRRVTCGQCGRQIGLGDAIRATRTARVGGGPLVTRYTHTQCYHTSMPSECLTAWAATINAQRIQ